MMLMLDCMKRNSYIHVHMKNMQAEYAKVLPSKKITAQSNVTKAIKDTATSASIMQY